MSSVLNYTISLEKIKGPRPRSSVYGQKIQDKPTSDKETVRAKFALIIRRFFLCKIISKNVMKQKIVGFTFTKGSIVEETEMFSSKLHL